MRHLQSTHLDKRWHGWDTTFSTAQAAPGEPPADACAFDLPMDVRTMLARAGRVPDPRMGRQSLQSDWIVTREWWFRTMFQAPALPGLLRFYLRTRGVDQLAEYFVNGRHIGSSESFNQVDYFDVTSTLRASGENELAIRLWSADPNDLESPADIAAGKRPVKSNDQSLKSLMFYGGDHNPFLFNAGLAIAPELIVADGAILRFVSLDYTFEDGTDRVRGHIVVHADVWRETRVDITIAPENFEGETHSTSGILLPGQAVHRIPFNHRPVVRWMPFQLGKPNCYRLTANGAGQRVSGVVGFRQFEKRHNDFFTKRPVPSILDWHPYENNGPFGQEYYKGYDAIKEAGETWPDTPREGSYDYQHVINNHPFFVMGGSVVPPTLFWADWSGDHLRALVQRAVESNNNTLRIWGGGYVMGDEFFEEASLLGLMVSHDFPNFLTQTKGSLSYQQKKEREFRNIARQLNAHPSVVIFNGGNEMYQIRDHRPLDPLFEIMDRVVREEASPQLFHRSCPINPEVHGPWFFDLDHAARYKSYKTIFNSECGCQAAPALASLQKVMNADELNDVFGATWLHRMADPGYFSYLVSYSELFGPAREQSPANVVEQTQLVQSLAYQYIAEEFRRQKPYTSGFTTWEFNEPWIDVNWGIIDADLVPKRSFETFKRACAKHLISLRFGSYVWAEGSDFTGEIWLSSESLDTLTVAGSVTIEDATGTIIARQKISGATRWMSAEVGRISLRVPAPGRFIIRMKVIASDGTILENEYPFVSMARTSVSPVKVLFVSGDVHEADVTFEFFRSAGLTIDRYDGSGDVPDLATYAAVVLGPMFNPISTLGAAFFASLKTAIEAGAGFVYFAYNTSAYLSGRYPVDELRGSVLEAILPVTFTRDHYGNSEDARVTGAMTTAVEHDVFKGIDLKNSPNLGLRVGCFAREDATLIAKADDGQAVLAEWKIGKGRAIVCTAPFGGHNYQQPAFRGWGYANHLLTNIVEYAARGAVGERERSPHPLKDLLVTDRHDDA